MNQAITALDQAAKTAENNEPINVAAGKTEQAELEREVSAECHDAINILERRQYSTDVDRPPPPQIYQQPEPLA